jgi:hypothetical protein
MVHVVLFKNANFHGDHKHVVAAEPNLNASDDHGFNDAVSSLVVLDGNWRFYVDAGFKNPFPAVLGPGLYPSLSPAKIANDQMSSLQPTDDPATVKGTPLQGHVILFKDANYVGDHKHVFAAEPNLNASDDNGFNDAVSSLAILTSNWEFYANSGFQAPYKAAVGGGDLVLGPGGLPFVANIGIKNDDMSSLRPVTAGPNGGRGQLVQEGVILFEHANFHGNHKHILMANGNLGSSIDNSFNDKTSSIAVLSGVWDFFKDATLRTFMAQLRPGAYPSVEAVGIANDALSSLEPV